MDNIFGSNHFHTIGAHLKQEFGCRVSKLSLDAGFTCPNRDGNVGQGGCLFCAGDGAGHYASPVREPEKQVRLLSGKWPEGKYLAYFQNHTNTYGPLPLLRRLYHEALSFPGVVGLAIATRPDCLGDDVLDLLEELNGTTYLWVELGLQTIHDHTAERMNRCYPTRVFYQAMDRLSDRGIRTVVHLIFGLPGESRQDMLASSKQVGELQPFGVKYHQLYVMRGAPLADLYIRKPFPLMERQEYVGLVVDALEMLPQSVTVHRLTGDAPQEALLAPLWCLKKRDVLNGIQKEFSARGTFQGCRAGQEGG